MEANFRLKTKTGETVRKLYQFFEWESLRFAAENNLPEGKCYNYGNSGESFEVLLNTETEIAVLRHKKDKIIEARKIYKSPAEDKTEKTNTPEVSNSAAASNDEIKNTINKLSELLIKRAEGSREVSVDMQKIEDFIDKKISENQTVKIQINDVPTFETEKKLHENFSDVLFWASQKQPVYLFGPAGTGKNVIAEQVAEALNLPFYYAGCLQQKYELEGFVNATGEYESTEFFKAFTEGGIFMFDEIDGTAAEVLIAFNAALANGYYNFPKYGKVKAHENFIVIAAGNTTGRGASDTYNGRYQLDASTLDRFVFINIDYSREIALQNANNNIDIVDFAEILRNEILRQQLTYTVSNRAIKRLAICYAANIPINKALCQSVCGGWASEDICILQNAIEIQYRDCKNEFISEFLRLNK